MIVVHALASNEILIDADSLPMDQVLALRARRWDVEKQSWVIRHTIEGVEQLRGLGADVSGLPPTTHTWYQIGVTFSGVDSSMLLLLQTSETDEDREICRALPDYAKYVPRHRAWVLRPTSRNILHLVNSFPQLRWLPDAALKRDRVLSSANVVIHPSSDVSPIISALPSVPGGHREASPTAQTSLQALSDYRFHTEPYNWQREAFLAARDKPYYALWMEPGTGKTKVALDIIAYQYLKGEIDAAVIICPATMKDVWVEQIEEHLPPHVDRDVYVDDAKTERWVTHTSDKLRVLITNYESWISAKRQETYKRFLSAKYTVVCDESTRIKSHAAKRTKAITKLTRAAAHRYIMTGTPITQGPLDAFSQMRFLDVTILGHTSFYSYRNRFAIMGGFNGRIIVGYANLAELNALLEPHVFKASKDLLDLPPKTFLKRFVELSDVQRDVYDQLKTDLFAQIKAGTITVTNPLTQMLRFQQIVGGFLPLQPLADEDDEAMAERVDRTRTTLLEPTPPKLQALLELVDTELDGKKVLIFARFRPEIELIASRLREIYGQGTVLEIHGGISRADRTTNRLAFQDPDNPSRFLVMQPQVGGVGLTLTASAFTIYYSNTFSLEDRVQTEDRTHRLTQLASRVVYYDLVAKVPCDMKVLQALRSKKKLSNLVMGEAWKEWL